MLAHISANLKKLQKNHAKLKSFDALGFDHAFHRITVTHTVCQRTWEETCI